MQAAMLCNLKLGRISEDGLRLDALKSAVAQALKLPWLDPQHRNDIIIRGSGSIAEGNLDRAAWASLCVPEPLRIAGCLGFTCRAPDPCAAIRSPV